MVKPMADLPTSGFGPATRRAEHGAITGRPSAREADCLGRACAAPRRAWIPLPQKSGGTRVAVVMRACGSCSKSVASRITK
jgi:hypothetical protein